ncbi:hypothetical protein ABEX25_17615 [Paenibacillus thiaminolyticus]|uniref:hypothetical protein n=1 Tax=Paenibacillus thiaminolyticus TaxID=49283 RepID=UPI003D27C954
MEEIKPMLVAILDRMETESARNEAFRMEMYKFQGEVRDNFQDLQQQLDYIAGKMGERDRDLRVLKRELV